MSHVFGYLTYMLGVLALTFMLTMCNGCNLITVRTSDCDALVPTNGITLAFCGRYAEPKRELWRTETLEVVYHMDEALHEGFRMPPVSNHVDGMLVRIYDRTSDLGPRHAAGFYKGYVEPETRTVELYILAEDTPRTSAFPHEVGGHLYDHKELGVHTKAEWYDTVVAKGRHFLIPAVTDYVVKNGRAMGTHEPETALDMLLCDGPE